MKKLKSIVVLLVTLVLVLSSMILGCLDESQNKTIPISDMPSQLKQVGAFDYDWEGGSFGAITVTATDINGADYLVLSFDPSSGPGRNSRVFIFDTKDPVSPRMLSSIAHPGEERESYLVRSIAIRDGILYAGLFCDKGLWMVDISDPASPVDLGIAPVETNDNVLVSGKYLYSSGQLYNGIIICDVSNTKNVKEIKRLDISTRDCKLAVSGNLLFLGSDRTLTIYDISSPESPKKLSDYELEMSGKLSTRVESSGHTNNWSNLAHISDIQASGEHVYIAFGAGQVRVIDVSNPASPRETTPINLGKFAIALTLKDNLLYITESDYESKKIQLGVVDVSEPENPIVIGSTITKSDFVLGGVTFTYCWARPQIAGDFIYVPGMRYLDIFELR